MSGLSEFPGQDPVLPGNNPEDLHGFEADPPPRPHGEGDPGRTLGIVGFILAILFNIIGLIVSIVAYNKSKKAGFSNGWAAAGIVIGVVEIILGGALSMLLVANGFAFFGFAN